MTVPVPPTPIRDAMIRANVEASREVIARMKKSALEACRGERRMIPLSESGVKIVEPDAATIERAKVIQAAADERAKAAATPRPPPVAQPQGPGADQDPRYSETIRWALGVAVSARKDLEDLQTAVRCYNACKAELEDPVRMDAYRASMAHHDGFPAFVARRTNDVENWGATAQRAAGYLARDYSLDRAALATDASGFLSLTAFTFAKTGPGWTVAITSQGAATVFADGENVSALVDNRKMSGGVWFERAPGQITEVVV